jgi:hypothetical protein
MNKHLAFTTLSLAIGTLITIGIVGSLGTPAAGAAAATGSTYFPLTATRLLDTRANHATLHAAGVATVPIAGVDGVPGGVTAVVLNITVVNGTSSGFLTAYPDGVNRPTASNLNWVTGQAATPNLVTVPVGNDGKIDLYNAHGNVDVIADLEGYFAGGAVLPPPTTTTATPPSTTTTTTLPSTTTTNPPTDAIP